MEAAVVIVIPWAYLPMRSTVLGTSSLGGTWVISNVAVASRVDTPTLRFNLGVTKRDGHPILENNSCL